MIVRRKKANNFTIICNEVLKNKNLSARAKGIWAYLMTLPDDWQISKLELVKNFTEGRDAFNRAFIELEKAGYIVKERKRIESGLYDGWEYIVNETTDTLETRKSEIRKSENQTTENLQLLNTNKLNTELLNTKEQKKGLFDDEDLKKQSLEIWDVYPNKRRNKKDHCLKKIKQAIKEVGYDYLLGRVSDYAQLHESLNTDPRFIHLSSTFWNQRIWDEVYDNLYPTKKSAIDDFYGETNA